jgi:hypothetical protein
MHRALWSVSFILASACGISHEADPVYSKSPSAQVSNQEISDWNEAFAWGDAADAGYLRAERDPIFSASVASSINSTDVSNWNSAFSWGNHATAGYLKTETDPVFSASPAAAIGVSDISNWNSAFGWGNHALAGYLKTDGSLSSNSVPRWNGSQLVTSPLSATDSLVGVGTTAPNAPLEVYAQQAAPSLDQSQTTISGIVGNPAISQTFTPAVSGLLTEIDVYLGPSASSYTVTLETLGSVTLATATCGSGAVGWTACRFPAPGSVSAGTQYRMAFSSPTGVVQLGLATSNVYSGGSLDQMTAYDLGFKTYVGVGTLTSTLSVGTGAVNVNTLLHLTPMAGPPAGASSAGDIYFDSTLGKLRYYNGSSWTSL